MKITYEEYCNFWSDYITNRRGERFGQAFINRVLPKNLIDAELFYENNPEKAEDIIRRRYMIRK